MVKTEGHRKGAFARGGGGRVLQNKMSKTTKRKLDRRIDKRRRREEKELNL
jgi:hypothetical protein